eukprot:6468377-Amphidinium_carterae.5
MNRSKSERLDWTPNIEPCCTAPLLCVLLLEKSSLPYVRHPTGNMFSGWSTIHCHGLQSNSDMLSAGLALSADAKCLKALRHATNMEKFPFGVVLTQCRRTKLFGPRPSSLSLFVRPAAPLRQPQATH